MSFEELIKSYSKPIDAIPVSISRRGILEGPIKAILFDVYGTLLISEAGDIGVAKEWANRNIHEIAGLLDRYCIHIPPHICLKRSSAKIEKKQGKN